MRQREDRLKKKKAALNERELGVTRREDRAEEKNLGLKQRESEP